MELTPCKSSHISSIGYLEAEHVLLVRYKDGSLYARSEVPPTAYADLMCSPSKGGWLNHHREFAAILISRKEDATQSSQFRAEGAQLTLTPVRNLGKEAMRADRRVRKLHRRAKRFGVTALDLMVRELLRRKA